MNVATHRAVLLRHASALRETATELMDRDDFATSTPVALARLLGAAASAIEALLRSGAIRETLFPHAQEVLEHIGDHMRYVERSRIEHTPWSMIQALERFVHESAGPDVDFVIRPRWSYMYGVEGDFVRYYRDRLFAGWASEPAVLEAFAESERRLFVLSFPRSERTNALLHANFAHEMGHSVADQWRSAHFQEFWVPVEKALRVKLADQYKPQENQGQLFAKEQWLAERTREAQRIADRALVELIADQVGYQLLGPASLFAAAEFASRESLDSPPGDAGHYPPWRYRLRMLHERLVADLESLNVDNDYGCSRLIKDWAASLHSTVREAHDARILRSRTVYQSVYEAIAASWEEIRSRALSLVIRPPYSFSVRAGVIGELVERLRGGLIPNETGVFPNTSPAGFDDILNAGPGADRVLGGDGDDVIRGGDGDDNLQGQDGDDVINGDDGDQA